MSFACVGVLVLSKVSQLAFISSSATTVCASVHTGAQQ